LTVERSEQQIRPLMYDSSTMLDVQIIGGHL
jgi:hypothetical protein